MALRLNLSDGRIQLVVPCPPPSRSSWGAASCCCRGSPVQCLPKSVGHTYTLLGPPFYPQPASHPIPVAQGAISVGFPGQRTKCCGRMMRTERLKWHTEIRENTALLCQQAQWDFSQRTEHLLGLGALFYMFRPPCWEKSGRDARKVCT